MTHASEDDLIMAYYDEAADETVRHLAECDRCQEELAVLRRLLDAARDLEVPDPGPSYGRSVWRRLEPRLAAELAPPRQARRTWLARPPVRRLAWLAAGLAFAVGGYLAGRLQRPVPIAAPTVAAIAANPEAVLRVALAGHFDRTRRLAREVSNVSSATAPSSLSQRARRLLGDNRLFRLAAESSDPALVLTLEELERWLLDVAHLGPETASLDDVRRRLRQRGLLLKLDVIEHNLNRRSDPLRPIEPTKEDSHDSSI